MTRCFRSFRFRISSLAFQRAAAAVASLVLVSAVWAPAAAALAPLAPANLAPQHLFLLEPPPESPTVVEHAAVGFDFDYATIYIRVHESDRTRAALDMEVARVLLSYAQTLPGRVEARLDVPVLWKGAGAFDGLVNGFHNALGLPSGNRDDAPTNEYHYSITDGRHTYDPEAGLGLGDVVLRFKRELPLDLPLGSRLAARVLVKLPTGSASRGFGSGKADGAIGVVAATGDEAWRLFGALDGVYLGGSPDPALPMDTHWAVKASGGLGLKLWSLGEVIAQVEYFTTPYGTGSKDLDRDVGMFSLAYQRTSVSGLRWNLGFTEDLAPRASPDFSVFAHILIPY